MGILFYLVGGLIVFGIALFFISKFSGNAYAMNISTEYVSENKANLTLIDVREPAECKNDGYIEGAKNIPLGSLANNLRNIPKDKEVVVYCRSGGRSGMAASQLAKAGYTNIKNMSGGIMKWKSEGRPVK